MSAMTWMLMPPTLLSSPSSCRTAEASSGLRRVEETFVVASWSETEADRGKRVWRHVARGGRSGSCLTSQLVWSAYVHRRFSHRQHGFQAGRSAADGFPPTGKAKIAQQGFKIVRFLCGWVCVLSKHDHGAGVL